MSTLKILDGQEIVVLDFEGNSFINPDAVSVGSTFTLKNVPITPVVEECASNGDQDIEFEPNDYIQCSSGNRYVAIVGGRPRVRPR